jgi:hypothetical protein
VSKTEALRRSSGAAKVAFESDQLHYAVSHFVKWRARPVGAIHDKESSPRPYADVC